MRTEWLLKIKEVVTKQLKVGFIKPLHQVDWIANVVPVPKKDGRMCMDFRDLNKACLKDDFFSHIDVLVDNTASNALLSSYKTVEGRIHQTLAPSGLDGQSCTCI